MGGMRETNLTSGNNTFEHILTLPVLILKFTDKIRKKRVKHFTAGNILFMLDAGSTPLDPCCG